jgi:hypothetical protein
MTQFKIQPITNLSSDWKDEGRGGQRWRGVITVIYTDGSSALPEVNALLVGNLSAFISSSVAETASARLKLAPSPS